MTEVEIPAAGSFRFDGRVALITGAGRNVGAAIARELHLGGANVAVTDANAGWAEETARALDPTGETVMAIELDVREVGHFEAARDAVIAKWGKLDIVVRAADKLIEQGRITINGKLPELGTKVAEGDVVAVDGKPVGAKVGEEELGERVYLALHKPVGIVCTTDRRERDNIVDFIGHSERIFPIGRLDKPSEGLILPTNDRDIVNQILRARNHHEKE